MEVLIKGLRLSNRAPIISGINPIRLTRSFHSIQYLNSCRRFPNPSYGSQNHINGSFPYIPVGTLTQQLSSKEIRHHFHRSVRVQAEDPQAFKPRAVSEADWQNLNDGFEKELAKRSWFFRPFWRLIAHPKYQIGQISLQFFLISGLITAWIYMWFFMGYPTKPAAKDGVGRVLTDEELEEMETIENYLHYHPVVQAIRSQKFLIESRPHWAIPDRDIPHNLTGGTFRRLGLVSVAPIAFSDGEGKEFYAVLHVGRDLCGPRGIVHNGVLATIADESLARCCFPALPNRIGVTANLNVEYQTPLPADSYVLVRAKTVKLEGRKAWVEGTIESLGTIHQEKEPIVYAKAKGLFIEPKYAAIMKRIMLS